MECSATARKTFPEPQSSGKTAREGVSPKPKTLAPLQIKAPSPGRAAGSQDTTRIHNSTEEFQDSGYQGRLIQGDSVLQVLFIAVNCGAF